MRNLAALAASLLLIAAASAQTGPAPAAGGQPGQDLEIRRAGTQPSRKGPFDYFTGAVRVLIVTAGVGRIQRWGGAIEEIRPGDVIWIPPGVKHWHGAAAGTGMTHIAIQEQPDGKAVDWLEKVSDEQYGK